MIELIIETLSWIIAILLFYFYGLRTKYREAILSFLFMQFITWPLGFVVAEMKLISYPVRFFEYASRSSFTFEYFIFPVVAALYTVYYPKNSSKIKKVFYSFLIVSVLTAAEFILERYTDNIEYLKWDWYWSWLTMLVTLQIAYHGTYWFIKNIKKFV
ncbi:CBO0543 family protein [Metabacillus bambusae]|uniref:Histidine kinase N-terminal 7TM region domain-containing protein n=1 Tax=Metabacillus bambusae TaxID=2795218 RepID=A0ABS3NA57_9BACI|nr:CBO0543 family protein [Metabacillus bambusae]MBO1515068.1 hypothetical protein [Metabacillus bambusae]